MKTVLWLILSILLLIGYSNLNPQKISTDFDKPYDIIDGETYNQWLRDELPQGEWFSDVMHKTRHDKGIKRFDYRDRTYLLISGGSRGSGGFSIQIHDLHENEESITVVAEVIPPSGPAPDVVENPRLFLAIERTDKEVYIQWYEEDKSD